MKWNGFIAFWVTLSSPSSLFADVPMLLGEPYVTTQPIVWAVTNSIVINVPICRVVRQGFSETTVSNAMEMGSFKLLDRMPWVDKEALHFQDKRENFKRTLTIASAQNSISYFDKTAQGPPIRNVPTLQELDKLALRYLMRLGGDSNQIVAKRRQPREGTVTSYDKKGGREIGKEVYMRGISYDRQIEGVVDLGSSFIIDFGNDSKPISLDLKWRNLQVYRRFKCLSPEEIIRDIKSGRAVVPPSVVDSALPDARLTKSITVTKMTLFYPGRASEDFIYPFAQLELLAEMGGDAKVPFYLNCPIIDAKQ